MSLPRLVLLCRRFWPLVAGPDKALAYLARGARQSGCEVTLLTPRWQADWPEGLEDQGVRVWRLASAPEGFWARRQWRQQLVAWLCEHRESYDLVLTSGLDLETQAAAQARRVTRRPYVLRLTELPQLRSRWQMNFERNLLRSAAAITTDGPALCAALRAAAGTGPEIRDLPDGVPPTGQRTVVRRQAARHILSEADSQLELKPEAPLAVYLGPLVAGRNLQSLIEAWRQVVEQLPDARLWLVGSGPLHDELNEQIETAALQGRVVIAGHFDELEEVLLAADVYLEPGISEVVSLSLREAQAAGLPCILCAEGAGSTLVTPGETGLLVPDTPTTAPWSEAILSLLQDLPLAEQYGVAAQEAAASYSLAKVVSWHLELWTSVCRQSR